MTPSLAVRSRSLLSGARTSPERTVEKWHIVRARHVVRDTSLGNRDTYGAYASCTGACVVREPWMLERLQRETASHHLDANEDTLSMVCTAPTLGLYTDFLVHAHAFEGAFDAALDGVAAPFDVRERVQIAAIREDLHALGIVDAPLLGAAPHALRAPEALGWLYVVERGRRLHGMIERHLRARLPSAVRVADAYLTRTATTGSRWRELGEALDEVAITPRHAQRVVEAARVAFRARRASQAIVIRARRLVA